jgi:hypothetical protein
MNAVVRNLSFARKWPKHIVLSALHVSLAHWNSLRSYIEGWRDAAHSALTYLGCFLPAFLATLEILYLQ